MHLLQNQTERRNDRIKEILWDNGYPEEFVLKQISKKITQFSRPKPPGTDNKCPVYLWVTYTGKTALEKNVRIVVENCYRSVPVQSVFVSRPMLPASRKVVLPAIQTSSIVYEHKCLCDSWYVRRTPLRLQDCIEQHVPKCLLLTHTGFPRVQPDRACKRRQPAPECGSAIGKHLLENDQCAANYNEDQFSILDMALWGQVFFISVLLEASYIRILRPNLY